MNRSKAKGTRYEARVIGHLKRAGIMDPRRTAPGSPSLDIVAVGVPPIEAKHHANPKLSVWIRDMFRRHGNRWTLFAAAGDLRTKHGYEVVVMPVELWSEMIQFGEMMRRYDDADHT